VETEIENKLSRHREAIVRASTRRFPPTATLASYPMDRRRGGIRTGTRFLSKSVARQMGEHGMVGRPLPGEVKQIITGSIGFDDGNGVSTLFARMILWSSRNLI